MAKAPAKKAARKPAPKPAASPKAVMSGPDRREETMSIRKISNGYIVRQSWTEGQGPNAKYREEETFTKIKPTIVLPK